MNCRRCGITCKVGNTTDKHFCVECKCSALTHFDYDLIDKLSINIIEDLCIMNKQMLKNIEETSRLAKICSVMWLPMGIQPSEVDRFLKYFPAHSDIRKSMIINSEYRSIEMQRQIPFQDRSQNNLIFITGDKELDRCDIFFAQRKEMNTGFARLDHLDASEGTKCTDCSDVISFGEMCVLMPKYFQKPASVWHPNCFKCIRCQHLLIDYFFCWDTKDETGPYCLMHFDDRYYPRCAECSELIFEEEYASVLDEYFHTEHLRCHICDSKLANSQFVLDSDSSQASCRLWKCIACLDTSAVALCPVCEMPLNDSSNSDILVDDLRLHRKCVHCDVCEHPVTLSDPSSFIRDGMNRVFCLNCYPKRTLAQCQFCKDPINLSDKASIVSDGLIWHRQCLCCALCHRSLSDDDKFAVVDVNGKLSRTSSQPDPDNASAICQQCFVNNTEDVCEICSKRIDDGGINYQSRLFHEACFKCRSCLIELDPKEFTTDDDRFYCVSCYGDIFCKTCFSCKTAIFGTDSDCKMIDFETRHWHERCFNCFSCQAPLSEIGFLFGDDRLSCVNCELK